VSRLGAACAIDSHDEIDVHWPPRRRQSLQILVNAGSRHTEHGRDRRFREATRSHLGNRSPASIALSGSRPHRQPRRIAQSVTFGLVVDALA
jgi:hypothetical protein